MSTEYVSQGVFSRKVQRLPLLLVLRQFRSNRRARFLMYAWLFLLFFSILLGMAVAAGPWSGIPIQAGPLRFHVSVYPPLIISVFLCLLLGPEWGVIPAFTTSLINALVNGIPLLTALVFSFSNPAMLLILWFAFFMLEVDPTLHRGRDRAWFVVIVTVGIVISSAGALIWSNAKDMSFLQTQALWEGWLIGDLVQVILFNGFLQFLFARPCGDWIRKEIPSPEGAGARTRFFLVFLLILMIPLAMIWTVTTTFVYHVGATLQPIFQQSPETITTLIQYGFFVVILAVATTLVAALYLFAVTRRFERAKSDSLRDPLTGTLNRRAFPEISRLEMNRCQRLNNWLSVIFLDIDHFKQVNDRHGHLTGDVVLRELSFLLKSRLRPTDHIFRWGGEEFVVLLPHTNHGDAVVLAERIRTMVQETPVETDTTLMDIRVTISLGVTGTDVFSIEPERLVARADDACYTAKQNGRNRTEIARPFTTAPIN